MGLDVYVDSLTRYYAGNWETIVQQIGSEQGLAVTVVRANEPADRVQDPDAIAAHGRDWRAALNQALGKQLETPLDWDESADTPYVTDKPARDGYGSLLLLAAHDEHPDDPAWQASVAPDAARCWVSRVCQHCSIALAEHALFLMLYIAKNFDTARRNLQAGTFYHPINDELEGQTLGLVGLGASGQELARRARHLGMQLLGLDVKQPSDETLHELGVKYLGGPGQLSQLFGQSDYVSIHVPLTRATKKMVDAHVLAGLRPGGVLINVARGEVVDQGALLEALRIGQVRAAGLDVFAEEPIDGRHPLLRLDNVVATPHVAGVTGGTSRRRAEAVAENIRRVASGLYPLYTIHSGDV